MNNNAYISRRLPIHPANAGVVLDSWCRGLRPIAVSERFVRAEGGLWLSADADRGTGGRHQLRSIRGLQWISGRPVSVRLELDAWSTDESQLALRPSSLAWPVRTDHYARRVTDAVERVAGHLVAFEATGSGNGKNVRDVRAYPAPTRLAA